MSACSPENTSISSTGGTNLGNDLAVVVMEAWMHRTQKIVLGISEERSEIVGSQHHTSEEEDKLKPTQQRQETRDNAKLLLRDRSVSLSDSLVGILRLKQRSEEDDTSYKSCRLSNNSSLADSDFGGSVDSMTSPGEDLPSLEEPPSQPTMEKPPSFQDGTATVEGPHSMGDSASTLVGSDSMPSFFPAQPHRLTFSNNYKLPSPVRLPVNPL